MDPNLADILKRRLARVKERIKQDEEAYAEEKFLNIPIKRKMPPIAKTAGPSKSSEMFPKPIQDILGFCPPTLHKYMNYYDFKRHDWSGVRIKYGRFSSKEDAIIQRNVENFMVKYKCYKPNVLLGISGNHKTKNSLKSLISDNYFHLQLGRDLNDRPLSNVYKRARILYSLIVKQGAWQEHEIKYLQARQKVIGNKWTKIGESLGRPCWHVASMYYRRRKSVSSGQWTAKENRQLRAAVKKCLPQRQCWRKYPWTAIAKMVPTRQENQCRRHWLNMLCTRDEHSESVKWSQRDYLALIDFMYVNMVQEEHFVDWDAVFEAFNHLVPYNKLRFYWNKLKKKVPDHEEKDHEDIVLYLYHNCLLKMLAVLNLQLSDLKYWAKNRELPVVAKSE